MAVFDTRKMFTVPAQGDWFRICDAIYVCRAVLGPDCIATRVR